MRHHLRWLNFVLLAGLVSGVLVVIVYWNLCCGVFKRPINPAMVVARGNPTTVVYLSDDASGSISLNYFTLGEFPSPVRVELPKYLSTWPMSDIHLAARSDGTVALVWPEPGKDFDVLPQKVSVLLLKGGQVQRKSSYEIPSGRMVQIGWLGKDVGILTDSGQIFRLNVNVKIEEAPAELHWPDEISPDRKSRLLARHVLRNGPYYNGIRHDTDEEKDLPCRMFSPSWSPDGQHLALVRGVCDRSHRHLDRGVYLVRSDSGKISSVDLPGLSGEIRKIKYDLSGHFLLVEARSAPKTYRSDIVVYRIADSESWLISKRVQKLAWAIIPSQRTETNVLDE